MMNNAQVWCLALALGLGGAGCGGDRRSPTAPSPAGVQQESAVYTVRASAHAITAGAQLSVSWRLRAHTQTDGPTDALTGWAHSSWTHRLPATIGRKAPAAQPQAP